MTQENFDNLPVTKGDFKELIEKIVTKDDLNSFAIKYDFESFATKDDLKDFATKNDLKDFARKDDLKNFATKDDLKNFATKDDLMNFPTKDDLKNFATKHDLDKFRDEVGASFKELGEAIHLFAEHVDKRFDLVERDVTKIKSTMVTKDYLDEKRADQRGDLTVLVRKEDNKVKTLVEVLVEKKVLNEGDQKRIYSLEPFAQI